MSLILCCLSMAFRVSGQFSDNHWVNIGFTPPVPPERGQPEAAALDSSGNLYVGGFFFNYTNVLTNQVLKWDGNTWSGLGLGVNGAVYALATSGSNLYVGGAFSAAGGNPANNIAKWNGSSW